jgi:amino acid adenylation domain-containing protein
MTTQAGEVRLNGRSVQRIGAVAARTGKTQSAVLTAALRMFLLRSTGNAAADVRVLGEHHGQERSVVHIEETWSLEDVLAASRSEAGATPIADHSACPRYGCGFDDSGNSESASKSETIVAAVKSGEGYALRFQSAGASFERAPDISLKTFVALVDAALDEPQRAGDGLRLTTEEEAARIIARGDGDTRHRDEFSTLDRIVAQQAFAAPDAIAVTVMDRETTYGELIDLAASAACTLREHGVGADARVGVTADMSERCVAAILAIWALGATYVPIDPALPHRRMQTIVEDAAVTLTLVDRAYVDLACSDERIVLETIDFIAADFVSEARSDTTAFIIYTSGSTGTPKGVPVRHDSSRNAIIAAGARCGFGRNDRMLNRTAIAFDLSVYDVFTTLVAGATLVVAPRAAAADPNALIDLIVAHGVTHLLAGPALLELLVESPSFERCTTLRGVTSGGEALSFALCRRFFARSDAALYNLYGPSESAMLVTLHRCTPSDYATGEFTAPLGRPLENVHVSIRDVALAPVPAGIIGEIVIGGVQLSDGYLDRPDETRRRFVADPFRPDERLYVTGDLARSDGHGTITFLRRNDRQVKIRGMRVEPGEVVAVAESITGVGTAIVVARQRSAHDPTLILAAYVSLADDSNLDARSIRAELTAALPVHMVPAEIAIVAAFPLTVTGKIDRARLQSGDFQATAASDHAHRPITGFATKRMRDIYAIWADLLKNLDIGPHEDFFAIGGDSLLAVRLLARLEAEFGYRFALGDFLESMTIASIDELLTHDTARADGAEVVIHPNGTQPPLVFLHGDLLGGIYARKLGTLLGADQPLVLVYPHGVAGRPPLSDVETMAEELVRTIQRLFPTGPVRIASYSLSGLVAYEAARRLSAAGRDVRDVFVVGITARNMRFRHVDAVLRRLRAPHALRDAILMPMLNVWFPLERFIRSSSEARFHKARHRLWLLRHLKTARTHETSHDDTLYWRYVRAHKTYVQQPYAGKVTVLWPNEQEVLNGDLTKDWRSAAPNLRIVKTTGTHFDAVRTHFAELVAHMQRNFS